MNCSKRKTPRPRRKAALIRERYRLALGELEAGAGAALTVLLALFDARVAGDEAGFLQRGAEGAVDLHQRAGDAVLDGVGLAREPAAGDVHEDVVAVDHLGELERLAQDHLRRGAAEVVVDVTTVDEDLARAGHHPHAGDRLLAAAGGVKSVLVD